MFLQQIFSRLGAAFVLSALPLSFTAVLPTSAKAANLNFDNIYVFGDSLSDDGNIYNATKDLPGPDFPYPPSPPYFEGRFSNGPVWVEQLAPLLGLQPNPKTNFAFGGSSTGLDNAVVPNVGIPGVLAQVQNFTKLIPQADPNALYTVWGGANDYLFGGETDPSRSVDNLSQALTLLANAGAKNILVLNLPDLGKIPAAQVNSQVANGLTYLSGLHDSLLAKTIQGLSQTRPDAHFTYLDVNSLSNQILANPTQFGFTNVTDACLVGVVACANPDQYFFWDDYHPTTKAHGIIAQAAYSELSVPEPSDVLGILVIGASGAVLMYKRKHKQLDQFKAGLFKEQSRYTPTTRSIFAESIPSRCALGVQMPCLPIKSSLKLLLHKAFRLVVTSTGQAGIEFKPDLATQLMRSHRQ